MAVFSIYSCIKTCIISRHSEGKKAGTMSRGCEKGNSAFLKHLWPSVFFFFKPGFKRKLGDMDTQSLSELSSATGKDKQN